MKIRLEQVGKRFNNEWIFRNISINLQSPGCIAVLGPNGSGKSTLLSVLSGYLSPTEGNICFENNSGAIASDMVYSTISYCAPYIELIEELTVSEHILFHQRFKPFLPGLEPNNVLEIIRLTGHAGKLIKNLSSGMRQRLKLALALLSDSDIILLDEPTTNLDEKGVIWYQSLVEKYKGERLIFIASNQEREFKMCTSHIDIAQYKPHFH